MFSFDDHSGGCPCRGLLRRDGRGGRGLLADHSPGVDPLRKKPLPPAHGSAFPRYGKIYVTPQVELETHGKAFLECDWNVAGVIKLESSVARSSRSLVARRRQVAVRHAPAFWAQLPFAHDPNLMT